jgi:hypothetical protein
LLIEPAATNLALHSRDLANVVWVKVNTTAAKTAIGADGVASGATTLTASAANGTVLQTIVSASSARIFSAYVRRRTGTGTVEMTQNNGTTWTPITLTDSFQRFVAPTGTITNPIIGFRIVTSGDAIDVDFTQQEVGAIATSAISTAATSITRNADEISKTAVSGLIGQTQGTIYLDIALVNGILTGTGNPQFRVRNTAFTNWIGLTSNTPAIPFRITVRATTGSLIDYSANITSGKAAVAYSSAGAVLYVNGVQVGTSATNPNFSFDIIDIIGLMVFRVNAAAIYTSRLSDTELASLTTL